MIRDKILITGASGFVGSFFVANNPAKDLFIVNLRNTVIEAIDFSEVKSILHLAGLTNQMKGGDDRLYHDVNTKLTLKFAEHAKKSGVPHFIYISSIKVYGNSVGKVLNEESACFPDDHYGKSKLNAENGLKKLESETFSIAIVRPPLIYGPGVKGNMLRLMDAVQKGKLLPFKHVRNERTIVSVRNLILFLNKIIEKKSSGIFVPADESPVSTEQLINFIGDGLGRKPKIFSIPSAAKFGLNLFSPSIFKKVFGSFIINNSKTVEKLGLNTMEKTEDGIIEMAKWYKKKIQ